MRKSILACTVSVLMSPMAGWALGLGDIQVNSTLNQALKAEIELQSATKKDLESLHVGLASRKAYSRSNIEFSDYLKKFHFKVIQKNGKNYISITTRKPFKEPYANFLVEASWGSGRLLREYTMLVDPPEFVKANSRAPSVATTSSVAQVKRSSGSSSSGTVKRSQSQPAYSGSTGELVYGPTQKNDTLWCIAKKMAPANVSIDQMMMALLRDNPDAFVGNNINNLKAGYVLRIKDAASLNQLDRRSARRQVQEQYQAWKEARAQKVSTVSPVDRSDRSADETAVNDGQLKLIASGESGSAGTQGSLASDASALKEKLAMASEELESKEIENQELKARIKELEEILKTKASLVQLKDESLAALQKQKELQENGEAEPVAGETPESEAVEEPTDEPAEIVEEETQVESDGQTITEITVIKDVTETEAAEEVIVAIEKVAQDEAAGAAVDKTTPAETEQPSAAEEAMAIAQTEAKKEAAKAKPEAAKKPQPKAKPKPKPAPAYEPTLADDPVGFLMSEENLPYTAGGGGILVLLLAWLGLRGRGKKEAEFEESILDSQIAMDDSEFAADKSEKADDSGTEVLAADTETSFLSDFSSDDMESLQPDDTEADPIAEADVFMVYGRYQQAEELLKSAISKEPERIDYQMKLLEVYHGDNQKDAFAVQADVVRDILSKTNDDYELTSEWTRAKSWAEKLGVDIEMPDSFESEDTSTVSEEQDTSSESEAETTAEDLESTDEFSLDDVSDDLTLETTEIDFNEGDSVLGDLDTDGSIEDDTSDELSLDDLDMGSEEPTEDSMSLELDDLDTELSDETTESDMLNLDENTSETETEFELEDTETELSLEELDTDETSMDLDDISDDELSLDSDELLDIDSTDTEITETDTDESSLDLEGSMELEDSLELEESLELDDSLEIEESSKDSSENLDAELADDSFELDMDKDSSTSEDDLELLDNDMNFDELDDDFPELDAVGTKLDLAKAYIDMGDMESATSILNEVIDEGDDDQKTQAQELLDQAKS